MDSVGNEYDAERSYLRWKTMETIGEMAMVKNYMVNMDINAPQSYCLQLKRNWTDCCNPNTMKPNQKLNSVLVLLTLV